MSLFGRMAASGAAFSVLLAGCLSSSRPQVTIYEGPRGTVFLEQVTDRNFQAAHPISLPPTVIARVLSGVQVREDKTTVQTLLGSSPKSSPVFSDQETEFLTPLIASALQKAAADQRVGFKVITRTASGPETTAAALYAHGQSLHLTILEYRHQQARPDDIHMPIRRLPDPTGLNNREVFFLPESARRPDTYQRTALFGQPEETTLVIDYGSLTKEKPAASETGFQAESQSDVPSQRDGTGFDSPMTTVPTAKALEQPPATPDELQSLKDLVIKKDLEMENLKQELRLLRRQLTERDAQIESLKRKGKAVPRSQPPAP